MATPRGGSLARRRTSNNSVAATSGAAQRTAAASDLPASARRAVRASSSAAVASSARSSRERGDQSIEVDESAVDSSALAASATARAAVASRQRMLQMICNSSGPISVASTHSLGSSFGEWTGCDVTFGEPKANFEFSNASIDPLDAEGGELVNTSEYESAAPPLRAPMLEQQSSGDDDLEQLWQLPGASQLVSGGDAGGPADCDALDESLEPEGGVVVWPPRDRRQAAQPSRRVENTDSFEMGGDAAGGPVKCEQEEQQQLQPQQDELQTAEEQQQDQQQPAARAPALAHERCGPYRAPPAAPAASARDLECMVRTVETLRNSNSGAGVGLDASALAAPTPPSLLSSMPLNTSVAATTVDSQDSRVVSQPPSMFSWRMVAFDAESDEVVESVAARNSSASPAMPVANPDGRRGLGEFGVFDAFPRAHSPRSLPQPAQSLSPAPIVRRGPAQSAATASVVCQSPRDSVVVPWRDTPLRREELSQRSTTSNAGNEWFVPPSPGVSPGAFKDVRSPSKDVQASGIMTPEESRQEMDIRAEVKQILMSPIPKAREFENPLKDEECNVVIPRIPESRMPQVAVSGALPSLPDLPSVRLETSPRLQRAFRQTSPRPQADTDVDCSRGTVVWTGSAAAAAAVNSKVRAALSAAANGELLPNTESDIPGQPPQESNSASCDVQKEAVDDETRSSERKCGVESQAGEGVRATEGAGAVAGLPSSADAADSSLPREQEVSDVAAAPTVVLYKPAQIKASAAREAEADVAREALASVPKAVADELEPQAAAAPDPTVAGEVVFVPASNGSARAPQPASDAADDAVKKEVPEFASAIKAFSERMAALRDREAELQRNHRSKISNLEAKCREFQRSIESVSASFGDVAASGATTPLEPSSVGASESAPASAPEVACAAAVATSEAPVSAGVAVSTFGAAAAMPLDAAPDASASDGGANAGGGACQTPPKPPRHLLSAEVSAHTAARSAAGIMQEPRYAGSASQQAVQHLAEVPPLSPVVEDGTASTSAQSAQEAQAGLASSPADDREPAAVLPFNLRASSRAGGGENSRPHFDHLSPRVKDSANAAELESLMEKWHVLHAHNPTGSDVDTRVQELDRLVNRFTRLVQSRHSAELPQVPASADAFSKQASQGSLTLSPSSAVTKPPAVTPTSRN
eukprot:TRINITY_DN11434_c0_g1_i1.p1 TRINITY_DN11434_c0_g1~~TRINITY_DN11434_c0_g1_i1.p1  ORF type:complete len:1308 (-),score=290.01 TRINITY_DN11434_c0_g1_i1:86-3568(-)